MDVTKTLEYFIEVETTAAEILSLKDDIFNLHKRLNETRIALSEVTKSSINKMYMYQGALLLKQPKDNVIIKLKNQFKDLNEEIKTKGGTMKELVFKLQDLEKQPTYSGRNLVPLDKDEMKALGQVWGQHV